MLLLIDNYDSFTYNLVHLVASAAPGLEVRVVRNDAIDLGGVDALRPSHIVLSPGPCGPRQAGICLDLVRAHAGRTPILGVCLGHQCIAAAFGMEVARDPRPTHGKTSSVVHDGRGVFRGLPQPLTVMRYHSLHVLGRDAGVPAGWEISARTADDAAVVMGLRRAWEAPAAPLEGVQFHPESFLTPHGREMLANFLRPERAGGAGPAGAGGVVGATLGR